MTLFGLNDLIIANIWVIANGKTISRIFASQDKDEPTLLTSIAKSMEGNQQSSINPNSRLLSEKRSM